MSRHVITSILLQTVAATVILVAVATCASLYSVLVATTAYSAPTRRGEAERSLKNLATKSRTGDSHRWQVERAVMSITGSWNRLSRRERSLARKLLARPTVEARIRLIGYRTKSIRNFGSQHFVVHYATRTSDAPLMVDLNGNAVPDYVELVSSEAELAWRNEVEMLGWPAPPGDGKKGGDSRYDIYLVDMTPQGGYGAIMPDSMPSSKKNFITIDNDFPPEDVEGISTQEALRQTLSHEFFHSIQLGMNHRMMDREELTWLLESSAMWMETELTTDDKFAISSLKDLYESLYLPITSYEASEEGTVYGGWAYWEEISSKFGKTTLRAVLDSLAGDGRKVGSRRDRNGARTVDRVLHQRGGSLHKVLSDFALSAYLADGQHYGATYELPLTDVVVKRGRLKIFTESSEIYLNGRYRTVAKERLRGLSSTFYTLRLDDPGDVKLTFAWDGPAARISAVVGGMRGRTVPLQATGKRAAARINVPADSLQRIGIVITSRSRKPAYITGKAGLVRQ